MLKILVFFESESDRNNSVELNGLAKRLNAIGLQPIPGDHFKYEDLTKDDKDKIATLVMHPVSVLSVRSRDFSFGSYYAAIRIHLYGIVD